ELLTAAGDEESSEAYETLMNVLPVTARLYGDGHSQVHAAKRIAIEAAARAGREITSAELRKAYPLGVHCFLAAGGEWLLAAREHERHVQRYHTPKVGLGWSEEWMRPAALYVMAIREEGSSTEPF